MKVQLLLLLALAVPFCAFTLASPTEIPEDDYDVTLVTVEAETIFATMPASTEVTPTPDEVVSEPPTEAAAEETPAGSTAANEETEAPTDAGVTTELPTTEAPAVETEGPTEAPTKGEVQPVTTEANEAKTVDGVIVEDGAEEGLSSALVAGIVIGVLLAAAVVSGVVVAAVRRMGKYSP